MLETQETPTEQPPTGQLPTSNIQPITGRNQKIAITVLAFLGLLLIGLWFAQFKKGLTDPFKYKGPKTDLGLVATTTTSEIDAQKQKDTDGDGLNDWEEINIYFTSPFIEDNDGDGIKDGDEVKEKTDPNCPKGKDCSAPTIPVASSSVPDESVNQLPQGASQTVNQGSTTVQNNLDVSQNDSAVLQAILNGQADAKTLRQALLESGMDAAQLNKLSDAELMSMYQANLKNNANNQ